MDGRLTGSLLLHADTGNLPGVLQALSSASVSLDRRWTSSDTGGAFNGGTTALMAAARSGHTDVVAALLEAGASVDITDDEKWNALHYACFSGHASIAGLLAAKGCDAALRTVFEKATPLDFAVHRKFFETVSVLGGQRPEEYTAATRAAVLKKGLQKMRTAQVDTDGCCTMLHRYRVQAPQRQQWEAYLTSGATTAVAIPATDLVLQEAVVVHMYPSLPRMEAKNVIRHSSISGLQHITVVLDPQEPATMSDDGWGAGEEVAHGVHNALGAATEQNVNGMGAGLAQETPASPVQSPPPQPAQPSVPEPELFEGAYEAAARGWLPLKKKIAGQTTYHIAIAAPDLKGNYDTHSVCGKCVRHLGSHDKDILWSDVTEHLQPVRPNTEILSRWVNGKLSFDRAANGEWKIKSFGANWKTRHFLYGPNGLSYSKTDLSKKEKNSKIFTRTTEIIRNPSAAEFRPIAGDLERAQLHYFGLRFQHNTYQEALLMRVTDTSDKNIIVTHLEKTLNQLKQDEKWSHDSKPLRNKQIASNYLARLAEYRQLITETREAEEFEISEKLSAERQATAARAETEHLLRGADRSEGEVAKIMTQIRTMTKTLHKEHTQAKKENFDALQSLASERQRFEESAAQLKEAESALECKAERMQQLNDKIGQLRAERDMYIEDKKSIFARWRKMEERHTTNENKRHTALLAFSPPDSPCHPLRLHTLSDAEANRVLRSYTVSPQSTLLASISPATKQTPG